MNKSVSVILAMAFSVLLIYASVTLNPNALNVLGFTAVVYIFLPLTLILLVLIMLINYAIGDEESIDKVKKYAVESAERDSQPPAHSSVSKITSCMIKNAACLSAAIFVYQGQFFFVTILFLDLFLSWFAIYFQKAFCATVLSNKGDLA